MQGRQARRLAAAALSAATLFALGGCVVAPREPQALVQPSDEFVGPPAPAGRLAARTVPASNEFVGPPAPAKRVAAHAAPRAPTTEERRRAYSTYLERKFKVKSATAKQITEASYAAGRRFKIEPSLLLAIMAVESSFDPHAFNGTDMGLMQVNPRLHAKKVAKVGGEKALYEIDKNVYVGAWVLRDIRNRTASMREALLHYCGSRRFGRTYPDRVEEQRLALERMRPAVAWQARGERRAARTGPAGAGLGEVALVQ